jgi:hypothetical protein
MQPLLAVSSRTRELGILLAVARPKQSVFNASPMTTHMMAVVFLQNCCILAGVRSASCVLWPLYLCASQGTAHG